ncbi:EAL domain-containing protein [Telmatospirillum siberiense]|uniref:Uncharacterized protein n=1 Tax=Telmatospirillum siberiense TaxID=382514 RepID=A0A2N3PT34_9PROT|nr:EAL domain-containing protein [Telmatospirillum siberiense]PKU23552.1 hypothetical protein CWS72_15910 [Telmatospirillum siberiense]
MTERMAKAWDNSVCDGLYRIGVGIVITLTAFGLQAAFWADLSPYVWLPLYPAIFFSSRFGGFLGGMTSTTLATLLGWYFFVPVRFSFALASPSGLVSILLFFIMGVLLSLTHEQLRRANRRTADEKTSRQTHERTHLFIEQAPHCIALLDRDLRYLAVSRRWRLELGRGCDDLVGRRHYDVHPDIPEDWKRGHRAALAGESLSKDEARWVQADGTEHVYRWVSCPWTEQNGTVGGIILSVEDITADDRAEKEARLTATMFDHSIEGITITDAEGTILAVNPAFTAITGYSAEELIGKNPRLLKSDRHDTAFYTQMFKTILSEGYWRGEIWNRRKSGAIYPEWMTISVVRDAKGDVVNYIGTFIDISRAKESEEQLFHLAHHDPLTGLPNRLLLLSRVHHAMACADRDGGKGALLFLDLDHFKNVNDSLGHAAGDELLQAVAQRYSNRLREADTLCRMGGDEFIVLLENLREADRAADVARSLIEELKVPFRLSSGRDVFIGTSVGISIFPDDGKDAGKVLSCADAAMYQAKKGGRNTYRFYTESLTEVANQRVAMEVALRQGLERGEFLLHYQPLIDMSSMRPVGVEALLRWQRPGAGLVPPGQFIPLAEETGLILPLGEFVLGAACSQMKRWLEAGADIETVAVNLSAHQFHQADIAQRVAAILEETGLPPGYLELEITESALMDFGEEAETRLRALKDLGLRLAIDDFGTGYSSLAYLKRFPIDKIKVDQSFVRDIPHDTADMEIVATVVAMAKNLNLQVLAEGVETEAQLAYLRHLKCDAAQGYLFSRPVPPLEFPPLWNAVLGFGVV